VINKKIKIHSKTFAIIAGFAVALLPFLALAALTYSRNPSGSTPSSPLTFAVSADDYTADFGLSAGVSPYWGLLVENSLTNDNNTTECVDSNTLSHTFNISLPTGTTITDVTVFGSTDANCNAGTDTGEAYTYLEGDGTTVIFTVAVGGLASIFPAFTGQIGEELAPGFILLFVVLAGIIGLAILIMYTKRWIGRR